MFLYENNGQFIDVYKLEPKSEEIKEYKKKEMEKIPKKEKVWRASTNYYKLTVLEKPKDFRRIDDLNFSKIEDNDSKLKYIILLGYCYVPLNNLYVMDGIINVPESLYLLEALLNNRFDLIGDKDITEQLQLFDIQHIGRINTSALKNICEYELLTDSYDSIINRTNSNKNVVSKVKKLAR